MAEAQAELLALSGLDLHSLGPILAAAHGGLVCLPAPPRSAVASMSLVLPRESLHV
jgi:hypothetical protein